MKRQIKFTKGDGTLVYGDPYEIDDKSPQMMRYSESTVQDFEELRKAMIKYDFTTKDFKCWDNINVTSN